MPCKILRSLFLGLAVAVFCAGPVVTCSAQTGTGTMSQQPKSAASTLGIRPNLDKLRAGYGSDTVNGSKLPNGHLSATRSGYTLTTADGRTYKLDKQGHTVGFQDANATVTLDTGGSVEIFKAKGLNVMYGPGGYQQIEEKDGNTLVVRDGTNSGYVQTGLSMNGVQEQERKIWNHGQGAEAYYVILLYGPTPINWYQPPTLYDSFYYSWLQDESDIFGYTGAENWQDCNTSQYVHYGLSKGRMVIWLANNLLQQISGATCNIASSDAWTGVLPTGPDISDITTRVDESLRDSLADSVSQILQQESDEAASHQPSVDLPSGVAYPASFLTYGRTENGLCAISPGDVVTLYRSISPRDTSAEVTIAATKRGDCRAGAEVSVSAVDLAEMWNELHRLVDVQLAYVAENQGQYGLPVYYGSRATVVRYANKPFNGMEGERTKSETLMADAGKRAEKAQTAALTAEKTAAVAPAKTAHN